MKLSKLTYHPKRAAILICIIFLAGLGIGLYVERFRISDYRWVYETGSYMKLIMVFGTLLLSFLHPLIVWSYSKPTWKKQIIWMIVGLIPLFYFATALIISDII